MLILTKCPECYKEHRLSDEVLGQSVRCKECGHFFVAADESAPGRFAAHPDSRTDDTPAHLLPEVLPATPREDDEDRLPKPPSKYGSVRMWLLVAGGVMLVLVTLCAGPGGLGWYYQYGRGPATVTKANYDAIRVGMSEADVQALLGKPTRTVDVEDPFDDPRGGGKRTTLYRKQFWENGKDVIAVTFVDGKVMNWDATLDGTQHKNSDPGALAKALDGGAAPAPGPGPGRVLPPPPLNTSSKGRVTQANYDAIVVNQTRAVDMMNLIGFPSRSSITPGGPPVQVNYTYTDGPAEITVTIVGGVVTAKDGKGLK
jgi:predicted Zn finger-like uncharacterized protein